MSEPVFYIDRALGGKIFPSALQDAGIRVELHRDHFDQDAPDEEWIPVVAAKGWFALSNDKRIYRNPVQKRAVIEAALGYFILTSANKTAEVLASNFIHVYPSVLSFLDRTSCPFIASVRRPSQEGRSGRVVQLYPK